MMPDTPQRPVSPDDLEGDLVKSGSPLFGVVWMNPERMGGTPCFYGTRVPVKHLFDYLQGNHTIGFFLDDFPGVTQEQVNAVLATADKKLDESLGIAA